MLTTASGKELHPIGIGTWGIGGRINPENMSSKYQGAEPAPGNEAHEIEAIRYSLRRGQNYVDCAEMYGGFYTDEVVGQAIAGLPREDIFIGDKLWKNSVARGMVRPTVVAMLKKLGTSYLDMLSIHAPWFDTPWQEALPQIRELIDEGVVRHFGVSNFNLRRMHELLLLADMPVMSNQMNYNVLHKSEVNQEFRDFCELNDIQIVAYQPIKRGEVLQNPTIQGIAQAHSATPPQVALVWLRQAGVVAIPKAISHSHIDENLESLDITLTDEELADLQAL